MQLPAWQARFRSARSVCYRKGEIMAGPDLAAEDTINTLEGLAIYLLGDDPRQLVDLAGH